MWKMKFSANFICVNCGLQHGDGPEAPPSCLNCSDERESMTHKPQRWTTLAEMQGLYRNVFTPLGDGVTGVVTSPSFGIGPEVFLIQTSAGNVLWDCFAYLDEATVEQISQIGGLSAIVISHPHMFGSVVEWSHALNKVPVLIHQDNQRWMPEPAPRHDPVIHWWQGESLAVNPALTVVRCGGHFPGSSVLHWREGAGGQGALFTGDTILPVEDRRWVSFMYSYPNLIPVSKRTVEKILQAIVPLDFDRIYGGPMYGSGGGRPIIQSGAKEIVFRSAERYIQHLAY
jgi:glyoxylase-like metal-dependent hydrolase (beta-lactamase superfamily II)